MEVVTGAMSTLLPKLADLIKKEYNLHKKVRDEIIFLKTELEYMEAALLKVSEAPIDQPPDIQDKLWARDVRELSYDLEDTIDAFMVRIDTRSPTKAKPHSFRGLMERCMELFTRAKIHHNISVHIEDIKTCIKELNERRDRYKIDNVVTKPHGSTVDILRLSALYQKATKLVGTEERTDKLVKMLMEGDEAAAQQLKVVSIVGFGGLGKTTLAKIVYEKLKEKFQCGAFVSVSLNPNAKNIFKNMLYQLGNKEYEATWDEEQLINKLRDFLKDKRYFIVIDDIWKTSVWKTIHYALIENECGSRVILTTRILGVAKNVGDVYKLQPISHADLRKLFYLRIFETEDKCLPNDLSEISESILKKCGGLPLAIITIASMLASKKGNGNTHTYWSKVYQSMGSSLEDSSDAKDMRRILSISYYDLPPHLKTCMLYLSSYPEDDVIRTKDLIWRWIGEGFILEEQGKSLFEVGEDYVDELINRSMIQPTHIDNDSNKAAGFRLHDMVLDLITRLSNEDGFLTTLGGQQPTYLPKKIRRLCLRISNEEDAKQLSTVSLCHVRSLTVSLEHPFNLLPALLTFPVLRVLDLSGCDQVDNQSFKDICNLFLLRSLILRSTTITEIPKEIENLQLLQVLDMSCTEVDKLPSTFVQLRQLLYLCVDSLKRTPDGFGNLKYLQGLDGTITVESPTMLHNLSGLTELRRVELQFNEWDESYEKPFLQCISNLVSLEYLQIAGFNGDFGFQCDRLTPGPQQLRNIYMASDTTIHAVPRWMSSLCALSILHISLITLGEEDLRALGSIPSLSHLHLSVEEPTQGRDKKLVINNVYPFLCLTKFEICKTTGVVFAQGAMPNLQTLVLTFGVLETLDQLGDFDFGLENLSSLVHVNVWMGFPTAKSEKVKAAEDAIRKALDMNPNKPMLDSQRARWLKVHIYCEGCHNKIMEILAKINGVLEKNLDPNQRKVTVSGYVDPTDIIEKLNKAGMLAQLLSYRYSRPMLRYPPYWSSHASYPPWYVVHSSEDDPNSCSVM